MRHQTHERQADPQQRVQALVGRVMSVAVAVAYLAAVAAHATLWPFAVLLCLPLVAFVVGWVVSGDRDHDHDGAGRDGPGAQAG
jgi:hypothetical protein